MAYKLLTKVDFDGARVPVVTETTPWPASKPIRCASVNSFGYGGANAHCILEGMDSILPGYKSYGRKKSCGPEVFICPAVDLSEHKSDKDYTNGSSPEYVDGYYSGYQTPMTDPESYLTTKEGARTRKLVLLPFSGHDEYSLKANISATAAIADDYDIADLAYTFGARRSRFFQRAFINADSDSPTTFLEDAHATFGKCTGSQAQSVGFVFTGIYLRQAYLR